MSQIISRGKIKFFIAMVFYTDINVNKLRRQFIVSLHPCAALLLCHSVQNFPVIQQIQAMET